MEGERKEGRKKGRGEGGKEGRKKRGFEALRSNVKINIK